LAGVITCGYSVSKEKNKVTLHYFTVFSKEN